MSSDGFFDDDFDAAALEQIDAIEAAALSSQPPKRPHPAPLAPDSSIDMSFDFDESDLQAVDKFVEKAYKGQAAPVAGPSTGRYLARTNSSNLVQTTLFGGVVPSQPSTSKPHKPAQFQRTKSATRNLFGQQAKKTLLWNQTAFAQSGLKRKKTTKGKGRDQDDGEEYDDGDDALVLPPPFVPTGPWPPPMKLKPDMLEAKHWIYPTNREKRDYQFNIVKHCLFENALVALPTGLGKTFIAGVVMLNYYRWFPEGKILFLATTKPLVAQQVNACHEACGIPGSDGIELTGNVRSSVRARYWEEKRVFYMTSQTLESDLESGICDPADVVLLVIDEAHHASGNHTYSKVVRFLTAKNPHFRILALTATPANHPDGVQGIVNNLHISHIEIRNEKSLDIKPYIFEKVIKSHIIKPTGDVALVRDMLAKYIDRLAAPLRDRGMFLSAAVKLHPFQPTALGRKPENKQWFRQLNQISNLARAMLYLLTGCITACHEYLEELQKKDEEEEGGEGTGTGTGTGKDKAKAKAKKKNPIYKNDPMFQDLMKKLEDMRAKGGSPHPKMEKLKDILINYFGSRLQESNANDGSKPDESCVIVFSSFRAVVEDIVKELAAHNPLIRAAAFVGQATDKKGRKGLKQKEQYELIERFKKGEFNVLVATSIGEEGLDIGEVDCTICYDTDKAPIRMVQRFGRTGRKRKGEVHLLLAESREENNAELAKGTYAEVQKIIIRGEHFDLYGDVPRLLPDHVKPECVEKVMEIQPYVRESSSRKASIASTSKTGTKRKRNDDPNRNIPPNISAGFQSAGDIWKTFRKKPKLSDETIPEEGREFDELGEDDETDQELESASIFAAPRRTQSEKTGKKKAKASAGLRRARTEGEGNKRKERGGKETTALSEMSSSQLAKQGEDDEEDMDLEYGTVFNRRSPEARSSPSPSPVPDSYKSSGVASSSRSPERNMDVIDLTDTEDEFPEEHFKAASPDKTYEPPNLKPKETDMSWLVDDDDEMDSIVVLNSSPVAARTQSPPKFERVQLGDESIEVSEPMPSMPQKTSRVTLQSPIKPSPTASSSKLASRLKVDMPPPTLPARFSTIDSPTEEDGPPPTFPVQAPAAKRHRLRVIASSSDDDEPVAPPLSQPRHQNAGVESTPVKRQKKKRAKPSLLDKNPNFLFDGEAAHSGDEVSEGNSDGDEEEDEYDRSFIKNSPLTQVSPSYNQTQIYRRSLMSQVPGDSTGPGFTNGPVRARPFGRISPRRRRAYLPSSSPPDEEPSQYQFGSFIVPDDADISLEVNSDDAILDL